MASDWKPGRLRDIADVVMGQSPTADYVNEACQGKPLLNGPTEFGSMNPTPVQFTTDVRKKANPGDLLFCVRGSTTGRMNWADQEYAIGRGLAAIRHRDGDAFQHFVRAVIELKLPELLAAATGSTFPNVGRDQLLDIPASIPPKEEQQVISRFFKGIDDKIEINRRINQTLEAMAQATFKSWFVDFDPVKAKIAAKQDGRDPLRAAMIAISGKPDAELDALPPEQYEQLAATASLFPDEMEESELGEIPRGWICPEIETLANVKQGKYLGKDEMQDTASAAFPFPVWGGNGILGYSQKFAYSSPVVLMTCRGSNCGLIKHTESAAWVSNNSFACIPKIGSTLFLLTYFQAELFDDCVSGSAQPQITYTSLKTKKLKFPVEPNVCSQFSKLMDSAFSAILSLNKQTLELSALRDTLLPKLLSGELSVADVTSEVNA